ncbi:MAG: hypothetical protein M3011_07655 [Actinomycetota bacterium]|nr:hypothetical protein [Actinomycetota bacterium]
MSNLWLVDIENPLLTEAALARIDDGALPDRLTWNTFQTLALWDPDVWVPRFVELACGEGSALEALEWSGSSVRPWGASLRHPGTTDVVIEGPEALIVAVATLNPDPTVDDVRASALEALGETRGPDGQVGFVMVVPPGTPDLGPWLEVASEDLAPVEGRMDVIAGSSGWLTWHELGELALDLAEESDELRGEAVHRLVTQIQEQFPDAEL